MSSAMGWATRRSSLMPAVASMVRASSSAPASLARTGSLREASARTRAWPLSAALFTAPFMVCANTATRIATPSRKPSCRAVLSMPEPAPLTPPGTTLMPAASSAGSESPMPAPTSPLRHRTALSGSVRSREASATRPAAATSAPVTAGIRGPTRSVSQPATGVSTSTAAGRTAIASPALSSV